LKTDKYLLKKATELLTFGGFFDTLFKKNILCHTAYGQKNIDRWRKNV